MPQLLLAVGIVVVALVVGEVLRRRRRSDPPSAPITGSVPAQLDRADFVRPEAPWLVAVFTSATCDTCRLVRQKVAVLESDEVAVADVEWGAARTVHERYGIDAVPLVVIADRQGVVHRHFIGPVTATDLWAAVASARDEPPA